jgi:2-amino-4-hydroxy-6-hydroxymethyldihydropteridine diphosphokinase
MDSPGGIYLLLGSNLGDRLLVMQSARDLIAEKVGAILAQSSIYETEPWGILDQPAFLNQVIEIAHSISPGGSVTPHSRHRA